MSDQDGGTADEGDSDAYNMFLFVLRGYVQWASLIMGGLTVFIFWVHWGTAVSDYGAKTSGTFLGTTKDTNVGWRQIFSLRPEYFVDLWTPLVFGMAETLQHLSPQYMNKSIAGTWVVRAIWFFIMSLFGQFGYAGNLGVICGYFSDFGICAPCLLLAVLDHECDEVTNMNFTTAKALPLLDQALSLCGLNALCPGLGAVQRQQSVQPAQPVVGGSA